MWTGKNRSLRKYRCGTMVVIPIGDAAQTRPPDARSRTVAAPSAKTGRTPVFTTRPARGRGSLAVMEPLQPGDPEQVGDYRLLARLGAGGMGQVFLGHFTDGREVAVKLIRPEHADSDQFRARFAREVRAAQLVGGRYTAQVLDADPEADPPWMVTAYVPGPSLREAVAEHGPLHSGEVRALGTGLAKGLAAVHTCELVHRDLKPANVILARDGPRIIDFGIARALDASTMTQTGAVLGTYAYMAPEQVRAEPAVPASDVFSLGCVLAFAATGRSPFDAGSIPATIHRIIAEPPDLRHVPVSLRDLVRDCLAKDPRDRPAVPDLLARLCDPAEAATVIAVPPRRSRRGLVIATAAFATAALTVTVALVVFPNPPPGAERTNPVPSVILSGHEANVLSVAFSPDGRTLASGGDGARLWDVATGSGGSTLISAKHDVRSVAFGNDGTTLAGAVFTPEHGAPTQVFIPTAWVYDVRRRTRTAIITGRETGAAVALSTDSRLLISSNLHDNSIGLWDVARRRRLATLGRHAAWTDTAAFSSDGRIVATGAADQTVRLWDIATRRQIGHPLTGHGNHVHAVAFTPDGKTLASGAGVQVNGSAHQSLRLWDVATRSLITTLPGHQNAVRAVAFSPDGRTLASGSGDETIRLWDLTSKRTTIKLTGHRGTISALAFSPDGKTLASGASDHTVRLWRLR